MNAMTRHAEQPQCLLLYVDGGLHHGAAVTLTPGMHSVGSDLDCDVVLMDAGIAPCHLRLEVSLTGEVTASGADGEYRLNGRKPSRARSRLSGADQLQLAEVALLLVEVGEADANALQAGARPKAEPAPLPHGTEKGPVTVPAWPDREAANDHRLRVPTTPQEVFEAELQRVAKSKNLFGGFRRTTVVSSVMLCGVLLLLPAMNALESASEAHTAVTPIPPSAPAPVMTEPMQALVEPAPTPTVAVAIAAPIETSEPVPAGPETTLMDTAGTHERVVEVLGRLGLDGLDIAPSDDGRFTAKGYVPDRADWEAAKQLVGRDFAVPVVFDDSGVYDTAEAMRRVANTLDAEGLADHLAVRRQGDEGLTVIGIVSDGDMATWAQVFASLRSQLGERPALTSGVKTIGEVLALDVRSATTGPVPHVVMRSGERYIVGSTVAEHYVLSDVTVDYMTLERGGRAFRYQY